VLRRRATARHKVWRAVVALLGLVLIVADLEALA
jgi:hypothetical protein